MTWSAQAIRLGGFALLLPLVLARFSNAEVSAWLLFATLAGFQAVIDFGFGPTFSREIAYGFAGHSMIDRKHDYSDSEAPHESGITPDWTAIASATTAMFWLYRRIAAVALVLLATFGSWAVWKPVSHVVAPGEAWIAWASVVLSSAFAIHGNAYASFLIGANRIAWQKRWESIVTAVNLLCQLASVLAGFGLLGLVLVAQAGFVARALVNRRLMMHASTGHALITQPGDVHKQVIGALWPAAWRTAIGVILSIGISQGIVVAVANLFVAAQAASVQLALRIMQIINQFSQAPYYTRLPEFNRLRAARQSAALTGTASKAMRLSLWTFVAAAIAADLFARPLLAVIHSQTAFPDKLFWVIFMLAVYAERFGAMHVQLLLTRNIAIAHLANGGTGIIWLISLFALFPKLGMLAIPASMLIAYGGFYAPCAALLSHARLQAVSMWNFERRTSLLPLLTILAYALV
jgi:hypothetical protein